MGYPKVLGARQAKPLVGTSAVPWVTDYYLFQAILGLVLQEGTLLL